MSKKNQPQPAIDEGLIKAIGKSALYKSNYGDFAISCIPCKYWWVRYAISCTYLDKMRNEFVHRIVKKIYPDYTGFSYRGRTPKISSLLDPKTEMTISFKGKKDKKLTAKSVSMGTGKDWELWVFFKKLFIDESDWIDCRFIENQKECPYYTPEESLKNTPLKEIKSWKGHGIDEA